MASLIDRLMANPQNRAVLRFVHGKQAHSDLAYFFYSELRELNGSEIHTPDGYPFACSLAFANARVFAFCVGMKAITLLLAKRQFDAALGDGGHPNGVLGRDGWIDLPVFDPLRRADHARWIKHAHRNALR